MVGEGALRGTTGGGGNGAFGLSTTGWRLAGGTDGGGGMEEEDVAADGEGNIRLGTGGTGGVGGRRGEFAESLGRTGGGTGDDAVATVEVDDDIVVIAREDGVWGGVPFGGTGRGKTWLGVSLGGLLGLSSTTFGKAEEEEAEEP